MLGPTFSRCTDRHTVWRFLLVVTVAVLAGLTGLTAGSAVADGVADAGAAETNDSVASGTTVYVGGQDGQILAFDVDGGTAETVWETDVGETIGGSSDPFVLGHPAPTVADGRVYTTTESPGGCWYCSESSLTALDATTGDIEWRLNASVGGSPTIVDGVVYVGSLGSVLAVDATTGDTLWRTTPSNNPTLGFGDVAPTVVNGTVYVTSASNDQTKLVALDAQTGDQEWTYRAGSGATGGAGGSPTYYNGTIYLNDRLGGSSTYDSLVHAVDATTGTQEWTFKKSRQTFSSPVAVDGTVYITTDENAGPGQVYALDADTGTQEWLFENFSSGWTYMDDSATVADDTVYFGTRNRNRRNQSAVYAVDADSGTLEWKFDEPENKISSTPTVHDGTVYVGTGKVNKYSQTGVGHLYGIDANTGTQEFDYNRSCATGCRFNQSTGLVGSPTVVEDPEEGSIGSRTRQGILGHTGSFPSSTGVELTITDPVGTLIEDSSASVRDGSGTVGGSNGTLTVFVDPGTHTIELSAPGFGTQLLTVEVTRGHVLDREVALEHTHTVGDVNRDGAVSVVDAVLIQRHLAGMDPAPFDATLADADRDGEVSIIDAVLVQQQLAGIRDPGQTTVDSVNASTAGDTATLTVTVGNAGGLGTLGTVAHRFTDSKRELDATATRAVDRLELGQGDQRSLSFDLDVSSLVPGTYYYEVVTGDDSKTVPVRIGTNGTATAVAGVR